LLDFVADRDLLAKGPLLGRGGGTFAFELCDSAPQLRQLALGRVIRGRLVVPTHHAEAHHHGSGTCERGQIRDEEFQDDLLLVPRPGRRRSTDLIG
jgi:hypothetical protein